MTKRQVGLPGVEEAFLFGDLDGSLEEPREGWTGEEVAFGAVGYDAAVAHKEDAVDFGNDVGGVMGDENDGGSPLCQPAEESAEVLLSGKVEGIRGFIEKKHGGWELVSAGTRGDSRCVREGLGLGCRSGRRRLRDDGSAKERSGTGECPTDHDAALLTGRHLTDGFVAEAFGTYQVEELFRARAHGGCDGEVGPQGRGGEEPGEDGIESGGLEGGFAGELGGDDSESTAELGEIPARTTKDVDGWSTAPGTGSERVELTRDGLQQR